MVSFVVNRSLWVFAATSNSTNLTPAGADAVSKRLNAKLNLLVR